MTGGADVFTALGWGLRKYAWVVALLMLNFGVLVPFLLSRGADVYEAQAQVGPNEVLVLPSVDPLPRLAESVFNNGVVADAVRQNQELSSDASVIPGKVELITAQDNIVFNIIGRDTDPETAKDLANLAATEFVIQLNEYSASVGSFALKYEAELPQESMSGFGGGAVAIVIGLVAGAIAGVGMVGFLLVIRRPVLDAQSAVDATGVPVLGHLRMPRERTIDNPTSIAGLLPLCRRLLTSPSRQILLTSPPQGTAQLRQLDTAISTVLERVRQVGIGPEYRTGTAGSVVSTSHDTMRSGASTGVPQGHQEIIAIDGPLYDRMLTAAETALTVLFIPEGISSRALSTTSAEYFTGGPAGIVFVNNPGWISRMFSRH